MVRLKCEQVKQILKEWVISIVLLIFQPWFSAKAMTVLRRRKSTKEEDDIGLIVLDEEQEGMIAVKIFITW